MARRRELLVAAALGIAGCAGLGGDTDTDGQGGNDTDTDGQGGGTDASGGTNETGGDEGETDEGQATNDGTTPDSTGTETLSPTTTLTAVTTTASETTSTPTSAESTQSTETAEIAADDGDMADSFGTSVAVSDDGTTAVIGANGDNDPNGDDAGSAYVFENSGGAWSQSAKLSADDGDDGDSFGVSVAVSADGTTAVIGADFDEDPNGEDAVYGGAGSAYVFEESDGTWSQAAKLAADDGDGGDSFGSSVAVSDDGTTAVIGANDDEDPNGDGAGSAYVFEESDGSWSQQSKLTADDGAEDDWFGQSVTMSGDASTVIIGAPEVSGDGSAYVFGESDGTWSQQAKLTGGDDIAAGSLGRSAAMSNDGTTAVIGAYTDDIPNPDYVGDHGSAGSAYVFEESDGTWSQQARLTANDGDEDDEFGWAVGLSDDGATAVIGAHTDEDPNGENAGSAYVFEGSDGTWSQETKLLADDGDEDDWFGKSVAVSGESATAIVGASQVESSFADPGSAYVYDV
jgi:hypothetical protein